MPTPAQSKRAPATRHSVERLVRPSYVRTFGEPGERKVRVHLSWRGGDVTMCGLDTAGDELIHDKPPELDADTTRVTCEHCQQIIALVRAHDRANNRDES